MPLELSIIPAQTKLESNADGQALDIYATTTRTFLCKLTVTDQIEQESLDVSIWGSADGQDFGKKPFLKDSAAILSRARPKWFWISPFAQRCVFFAHVGNSTAGDASPPRPCLWPG